jgi:hypothetical protein
MHKSFLALDKYLWFQKTKQLVSAGTILDVGGGEGVFETLFQRQNQHTILELSRKWKALAGNTQYVVYGGEAFPFRSKSFDIGIALQTLEHIPQQSRQNVISEFARVVRKQIIFAFPIRRLHFERLFMAVFAVYDFMGLPNMKRFYEEHLQYGLPRPELVSAIFGCPPTYSEYYFGKVSCLALLTQLIFPILLPLSALFARAIEKLNEREPVFALLCWRQARNPSAAEGPPNVNANL